MTYYGAQSNIAQESLAEKITQKQKEIDVIKKNMKLASTIIHGVASFLVGGLVFKSANGWMLTPKVVNRVGSGVPKNVVSRLFSCLGSAALSCFKIVCRKISLFRWGVAGGVGISAAIIFFKLSKATHNFGLDNVIKIYSLEPLIKDLEILREQKNMVDDQNSRQVVVPNPDSTQATENAPVVDIASDSFLKIAGDALFSDKSADERQASVLKLLLDRAIDTKSTQILEQIKQNNMKLYGVRPETIAKINNHPELMRFFINDKDKCPICWEILQNKTPIILNCGHALCSDCKASLVVKSKVNCPQCRAKI